MEETDEKLPPVELTSDTDNATHIPADEAPPHRREKYRQFRKYNTGMWNGPRRENTELARRQDNLRIYDAIVSKMGVTDYQQKRGRQLLDDLHVKSFGKSIEAIAFAVVVVVANQDYPDGKRYWPHPETGNNDQTFEAVGSSLDLGESDQMSVIMQVKSRTGL